MCRGVPYVVDPTVTATTPGLLCGESCVLMLLRRLALHCSLAALCAVTKPNRRTGTDFSKLSEAALGFGAGASYNPLIPSRSEARQFLRTAAPFIAVVSPSRLYGGTPVPWAHAVVVLESRDSHVIYHDPDPKVGGCGQSTSERVFVNAWQRWAFTALVVQR